MAHLPTCQPLFAHGLPRAGIARTIPAKVQDLAGVFLSYDREDAAKARLIALALEKAGHSVWWDSHIKGGAQYSKEIERALKAADAVVVLWSEQSVDSAWVRDEAAAGRDTGRLVPVRLDATEPPLGFRQYQAIDLSRSRGRGKTEGIQLIIDAIAGLDEHSSQGSPPRRETAQSLRAFPIRFVARLLVVALLAAAAFLILRNRGPTGAQTVLVAAADTSPSARKNARELLVNLGNLQAVRTGDLRLVGQSTASSPQADLIFETSGNTGSGTVGANLVLLAGKDRSILWSDDFEHRAGGAAGLKQQAGYTAARVLGCALEALAPENGRLRLNLLKLYLNACALLDETFFHDASQVIPIFERVIAEAPKFEPAWAKLLVAETNHYQGISRAEKKAYADKLRGTIMAARQVNPEIAEAYVAEIELVPGDNFYEQVRLIDRAAELDPNNVFVLAGRSLVMLTVGRLDEAVKDARKAARLDPLSPAIRSAYIQALLNSGQIEMARSELADAERLWPDATTVLDSRARLGMSFGNIAEAAEALPLMQSGIRAGRTREAFVQARLSPTQANIDRAIELATSAYETQPESATAARVVAALGEFDRTRELFNFLLSFTDPSQVPYFVEMLFYPALADLRADPRFMQIAARFGLLEYWRRSGNWPDFCADPDLPYNCKAEAAKLS